MKHLPIAAFALLSACSAPVATREAPAPPHESHPVAPRSLHTLTVPSLDGAPVELSRYQGKVLLVVNTASECGLTPQYEGLQALYAELAPRGVEVLAFPSNDFGGQEPGSPAEIREFCSSNYHVTFPMFSKVVTKSGPDQSPVYALLGTATGNLPAWNFAKYVVGKDGAPLEFFGSKIKPNAPELRAALERALAAP